MQIMQLVIGAFETMLHIALEHLKIFCFWISCSELVSDSPNHVISVDMASLNHAVLNFGFDVFFSWNFLICTHVNWKNERSFT